MRKVISLAVATALVVIPGVAMANDFGGDFAFDIEEFYRNLTAFYRNLTAF